MVELLVGVVVVGTEHETGGLNPLNGLETEALALVREGLVEATSTMRFVYTLGTT